MGSEALASVIANMPLKRPRNGNCAFALGKSVTLLPERSKLFKSHWSNQWLTSKIELVAGAKCEPENTRLMDKRRVKSVLLPP
jgi:hypothetical protein